MTQLEALRLADMLENNYPLEPEAEEAAAELRRLHEENEQLRQALSQPKQEPAKEIYAVLFAVEQAIRNGCAPWEVEAAFEKYEAKLKEKNT